MDQSKYSLDVLKTLFQNIDNLTQIAGDVNRNGMLVTKSLQDLEEYAQGLVKDVQNLEQEKSMLMAQLTKVKLELGKVEEEKRGIELSVITEHERLIEIQRDKTEATSVLRKVQLELDEINDEIERLKQQ